MDIHEGHRQRLKDSYMDNGLDKLNDINALELLLFYAVPRRDTNPIAHALLNRFGSLDKVFEASERELMEVSGIGRSAAALIRLIPDMYKRSQVSKTASLKHIRNTDDAVDFFQPRFLNEKDELLLVLYLGNDCTVLKCEEMGRGTVNAVDTSVRRIVETALKNKATAVYVAHNHPGGTPMPSREDDFFTRKLYQSLELLSIPLMDHIIFSDDDCISLDETGSMGFLLYP